MQKNSLIEYFIIFNKNQIKKIISEISNSNAIEVESLGKYMVDDGPQAYFQKMADYKNVTKGRAEFFGYQVINYLVPDMELEQHKTNYPDGPIEGSSYFYDQINDEGIGRPEWINILSSKHPALRRWKWHIDRIVKTVGMEYVSTIKENKDINLNNFYITYKDNQLKITDDIKNKKLYNIVSIINEKTSPILISKLILINNYQNKNKLFNKGKNFILCEFKQEKLKIKKMIKD